MHKVCSIFAFFSVSAIFLTLAINNALCQEKKPMVPMAKITFPLLRNASQ